jgi:hypothetical protein
LIEAGGFVVTTHVAPDKPELPIEVFVARG